MKGKTNSILLFELEREEGRESKLSKLLSTIYEDQFVGICQTKNENSSTQRELHVGTEIMGFRRRFKQGVREIKAFGFRKCLCDFLEFFRCSKR